MGAYDDADFSGWATKANLKCLDGRTIMPDAFAHMDGKQVPLVWHHGHDNPENVLGHAILEARPEGMYTYGYFNGTDSGAQAKALVQHKDINSLSIWANELVERSKQVFHGAIRELSLVLAGANPGAVIENVAIAHGADGTEVLANEAIIFTDIALDKGALLEHADSSASSSSSSSKTIQDVFDSMTEEQQQVVYFMVGAAIEEAQGGGTGTAAQSAIGSDDSLEHAGSNDATVEDVFNGMTDVQKQVVYFMVGSAVDDASGNSGSAAHSATDSENNDDALAHQGTETDNTDGTQAHQGTETDNTDGNLAHGANDKEGNNEMTHNVFENQGIGATGPTELSHDQLRTIVEDAKKPGMTLKQSFLAHAVEYGFENIDILFPDAKTISNTPELISRRQEWVNVVLNGVRKTPLARIKTVAVDVTLDQARAKGYVKGTLKKDEWVRLSRRITTPTTIYKKQKLDRDDIIDITDLDVVAFLKGEMRLMLDEEIARAILIGDGREVDDEDKVNEECIRPIAHDEDFFTHRVVLPSNISGEALVEAILRARPKYRGSGRPTLFLVEELLTDMLLSKDKMARRLYNSEADLQVQLRVGAIQTVDPMEDLTTDGGDLLAVLVNLADYTVGADRGGNVSMFDDFDIDYNQYKYLIETRMSGSLTRFKSAQAFVRSGGTQAVPAVPTFVPATGVTTIPNTTGVVYRNDDTDAVLTAGAQTAIDPGDTIIVRAEPATGYYFPHNTDTDWSFTRNA